MKIQHDYLNDTLQSRIDALLENILEEVFVKKRSKLNFTKYSTSVIFRLSAIFKIFGRVIVKKNSFCSIRCFHSSPRGCEWSRSFQSLKKSREDWNNFSSSSRALFTSPERSVKIESKITHNLHAKPPEISDTSFCNLSFHCFVAIVGLCPSFRQAKTSPQERKKKYNKKERTIADEKGEATQARC